MQTESGNSSSLDITDAESDSISDIFCEYNNNYKLKRYSQIKCDSGLVWACFKVDS